MLMHSRLRLFDDEKSSQTLEQASNPFAASPGAASGASVPLVPVPFGELVAAVADALLSDSAFLLDFADDEVQLTPDLYDVLIAFRRMKNAA